MEENPAFDMPDKEKFTIYTKAKCEYCTKVKILLEDNDINYVVINCDDYLRNDRDEFLSFIKNVVGKEWKTFPIVFNEKGYFIGGFKETREYLEKNLNFDGDF